mmetsp:Transcript_56490/g.148926  ORF Transcript_56490/g.148926 Transcript_56490/m.148926 type:complete len:237 (+) Transcript_56490:247-957(+)
MRSMTMADAPPPPLQMAAAPMLLSRRMRLWMSVTMMRAPEQPMGWPSASAPPDTSTLAGSRLSLRMLDSDTTAKAWFSSHRSTSAVVLPASLSALGRAREGDVGKSTGSCSASAQERMRARGLRLSSLARSADMITMAAPPSLMDDDVAAVTEPPSSRKAVRRVGIFSMRARPGSSSEDTRTSPDLPLTATGTISLTKWPPLMDVIARLMLSIAKSSCSLREMLKSAAHFSAHMPM